MQNEHIEYFKRFANCYLKWSHSNFDRIVREIIKNDVQMENERKQKIRIKTLMVNMPQYKPMEEFDFDFERDVKFGVKILNF